MFTIHQKQSSTAVQIETLPCLTDDLPAISCRICVIVPVRNEAGHLPAVIGALAHQVDQQGQRLNPESYEVLLLANNCSDGSAAIARSLCQTYPTLNLNVIEVTLPPSQANIGYARRLVMNEAYRRLTLMGGDRRIIASTDGDTEVSATWLASLLHEFDQGVDVVCGRILTRRTAALGIPTATSLYFLRYMAHRYLTAQLEGLLDPLPYDRWPRHYQHFGANMAVLSDLYGLVGGIPDVPDQEDVALYRRLQQADAKIRHSPAVKVMTSARRTGRANGGLAERLNQLTQASSQRRAVWVEPPQLTEARIMVRHQLRRIWTAINQDQQQYQSATQTMQIQRLSRWLGLPEVQLCEAVEAAPTFGMLLVSLEAQQRATIRDYQHPATSEISLANMYLRQRVQALRQSERLSRPARHGSIYADVLLKSFEQVQPIPLFSLTY